MARTSIASQAAKGTYGTAGLALTFTAADASNGNQFTLTGREILIIFNAHATSAKTVTLTSAPNSKGRTGDITAQSLTAQTYYVFGPIKDKAGWAQAGGVLYLDAQDNNIQYAIIDLGTT